MPKYIRCHPNQRTPSALEAGLAGPSSSSTGAHPASFFPHDSSAFTLRPPSDLPRTAVASTHNASNRFLSLPLEITTLIFDHADWPTARALRQTCTYLRRAFPVMATILKVDEHRARLSARDAGSYPAPCYSCLRMLPKRAFPASTIPQHYSRWGPDYTRKCTECLVVSAGALAPQKKSTSKIPLGATYTWRGVDWVRCYACTKHRRVAATLFPWSDATSIMRLGSAAQARPPQARCGRCRDWMAGRWWVKKILSSWHFWLLWLTAGHIVVVVFGWRALVAVWRAGTAEYSHKERGLVNWVCFTLVYTILVQAVYWLLWLNRPPSTTRTLTRRDPFNWLIARKMFKEGWHRFEFVVESGMLFVSCTFPFALNHHELTQLLAWAQLCWVGAIGQSLVRWDLDN